MFWPAERQRTRREHRGSGLDAELEDRLMTLSQQILDFQITTVRRVISIRLARSNGDTVKDEGWKGMIAKVQASEKLFGHVFKQVNDASMIDQPCATVLCGFQYCAGCLAQRMSPEHRRLTRFEMNAWVVHGSTQPAGRKTALHTSLDRLLQDLSVSTGNTSGRQHTSNKYRARGCCC